MKSLLFVLLCCVASIAYPQTGYIRNDGPALPSSCSLLSDLNDSIFVSFKDGLKLVVNFTDMDFQSGIAFGGDNTNRQLTFDGKCLILYKISGGHGCEITVEWNWPVDKHHYAIGHSGSGNLDQIMFLANNMVFIYQFSPSILTVRYPISPKDPFDWDAGKLKRYFNKY